MNKEKYNLLTVHTVMPIDLASSTGTKVFAPILVNNRNANSGLLYIDIGGYGTPGATGFTPYIYNSHNNGSWSLNTSFPSISTAGAWCFPVSNCGNHMRFCYSVAGARIVNARAVLELFSEYK